MEVNWPFKIEVHNAGQSLTSLAGQTGIPRMYLSQFANGRFNLTDEQLEKVSIALGCSVEKIKANGGAK